MFGKVTLVLLDQMAANSRLPIKTPNGKPVSLVCFAYSANIVMPCRRPTMPAGPPST